MIKTSIAKIAKDIGFDIAMQDDEAQSDLINGFSRGFSAMRANDKNTQICYIVDKLDNNSKQLIKELYEYVKLAE